MYRGTEGRLPLIGVGGVASGADAYAKIRAGASLVQLYTELDYHGPAMIPRIKTDLAARLKADGLGSVAGAGGADCRVGVAWLAVLSAGYRDMCLLGMDRTEKRR